MPIATMITIKIIASTFLYLVNVQLSLQLAAVGIDYGDEFVKVSTVYPGRPLDIVLTPSGQRKFINSLALDGEYRLFGSESRQRLHRNPIYTLDSRIPSINKLSPNYTVKVDDQTSLHWSEISANMLSHISDQIDADNKSLVMAVPPHYGLAARSVLAEAITLAGFTHLAFIDQAVAAGITLCQSMQKGTTVMIYDLGEEGSEVSILTIMPRNKADNTPHNVVTLGIGYELGIGGRYHDQMLRKLIIDKSKDSKPFENIPLGDYKKKLGLSDKVTIQGAGGKEFVTITREEFEQAIKPSLNLLKNPIDAALGMANKLLSDMDSIEIIGGSWRVPIVKEYIEEAIKPHTLAIHLNADEAIANGAGLVAASLSSKSFLAWTELSHHPLEIKCFYDRGSDDKPFYEEEIFPKGFTLAANKTIVLEVKSDFSISFYDINTQTTVYSDGFPKFIITGIKPNDNPNTSPLASNDLESKDVDNLYKVSITVTRDNKGIRVNSELVTNSGNDKDKNVTLKVKQLDATPSKTYFSRKETLLNYINKDIQYNNRIMAHSNLESTVYNTYRLIEQTQTIVAGEPIEHYNKLKLEYFINDEEKKNIKDEAKKIEDWLEIYGYKATLEELEEKLKQLNSFISPAKTRQIAFSKWVTLVSLLKKEENHEILELYQNLVSKNPDEYGKSDNSFDEWLENHFKENISIGLPNLSTSALMKQTVNLKNLTEARLEKLKEIKAKPAEKDDVKAKPAEQDNNYSADEDGDGSKDKSKEDKYGDKKDNAEHNEL